jgi:hypothetical protein
MESVIAVAGIGSHAMGTADKRSDVDLFVICDPDIVASSARQSFLSGIQGVSDIQVEGANHGWENAWAPATDKFTLAQVLVDMNYNTKDWLAGVVDQVIKRGATSLPAMRFRPYTVPYLYMTLKVSWRSWHAGQVNILCA